jgi:hypothetical protein
VSTASLRREVRHLKARVSSRRHGAAPADRVEFARSLGFEPDPWQGRFLRSEALRVLLNIARQVGKSTTAGILSLHQALAVPESLTLILAPAERQSAELMRKVLSFYGALGHVVPADSERKLGLELFNGSRIEALPGTEKTVRSFSGVDLLLLEEAARIQDALYYSVRPMLAVSGGRLIMLSTPWGKRGVFFEAWDQGGPSWERYEVWAEECPRISPEFLEEEHRTLPRRIYRQEYECAFLETEDQVFSYEDVAGAITEEITPLFAEAS